MFKAKINNNTYMVNLSEGVEVDGKILELDVSNVGKNKSSIIYNNKSYNTEIIEVDHSQKKCSVSINGKIISIELSDQYDELLKKLGMDSKASLKIAELRAPMPGLVLNVFVNEGDEIKKGDNLLILEAMKMENIIKSPADLVIKSVKISIGDKVEKNQALIVFN